jgi:hypothetical protein
MTPGDEELGDWWAVYVSREWHYRVRPDAVAHINMQVAAGNTWVEFEDMTGSRVTVRAALIEGMSECTAQHRAVRRQQEAAERAEDKAAKAAWNDDD